MPPLFFPLTVLDGVFQLSRQASLFGVAVLVECCWPHFQSHADLKQVVHG